MASNSKNLAELLNSDVTLTATDIANGAVTTDKLADGAVTGGKMGIQLGRRNLIINGAMGVSQRGTSFTDPSSFTLDRWRYGHSTGSVTVSQNSVSDLAGFQNSAKIQVTSTGSVPAGDQDVFETKIEGQDLVRAGWGQTGAQDLTLSFYYKSNSTDNRVAWFYNTNRGRDYAVIFAASAVDTWERITINIPADQTFDDSNGVGLYVRFVLNAGTDFTGGLASSWGAIGNDRYAGIADFHSSTNNYVEFTGVQLEVGDTVTPFEHRSYGEELQLCQRYYNRWTAAGYANRILSGSWSDANTWETIFGHPAMRTQPTGSHGPNTGDNNDWVVTVNGNVGSADGDITGWSFVTYDSSNQRTRLNIAHTTSPASSGAEGQLRAKQNPTNNPWIALDAEL